MQSIKNYYFVFILLFPILAVSQAETIFNGIQLNETSETIIKKLNAISESSTLVSVEKPLFPLAKSSETHFICSSITTKFGKINKAVFTFADDTLRYIEARGNVLQTLTAHRKDTARVYMNYDVYVKDKLFVTKSEDVARIITKEGMHTNLFTWNNPYMNSEYKADKKADESSEIPSFIKMGASLDVLRPILEENSLFTSEEQLDGTDPNAQFQLNCFGVDYLGFPRKIEARFGNETLNVVWILTAKGEEDRIRKALIQQYGEPIYKDETWEVFNNWQVALRKDKPEVLLMEQQIGLGYKKNYFKQ